MECVALETNPLPGERRGGARFVAAVARSRTLLTLHAKTLPKNWAVYVDDNDFGLGVYVPIAEKLACYHFSPRGNKQPQAVAAWTCGQLLLCEPADKVWTVV